MLIGRGVCTRGGDNCYVAGNLAECAQYRFIHQCFRIHSYHKLLENFALSTLEPKILLKMLPCKLSLAHFVPSIYIISSSAVIDVYVHVLRAFMLHNACM